MNTIYILWLRQLKKYTRSKPRMFGSLGQPILFLLSFGFGFGSIFASAGRGNYIQFLAPGIILMSTMFTAVFTGIELIWDRQFGFLKETMVAPVSRFEILLGRTLGGATVATIQGIVVFFITLLVGFRPHSLLMLPIALVFVFLVGFIFTAFGTAIASRLQDMQAFPLIMNFLVMPIFFLSGSLFPLQGLPKAMEIITRFDPLTYGIDGLREALIGMSTIGLATDFMVLGILALVLIVISNYLFERIEI